MPRNENHVYDEDGNDLLAQKPRRPLGTLFAGLGVLAALAAGGWAFHHYRPQQFGKIFSLPGQNPVIRRMDAEERWLIPSPSPAHNALLNALAISILQVRPIPGSSVSGPGVPGEEADIQVRVSNGSGRPVAASAALYFSTTCRKSGVFGGIPPWMPALLPARDSVWSVAHHLPGGATNPGNLYISLGPHQTKTGWMRGEYIPSCNVNQLVLRDTSGEIVPGGLSRTFPFPKIGPPMSSSAGD